MIAQTTNMDLVNSILCNPVVWRDIAPADVLPFDAPYVEDCLYFMVNEGDGVIIYHPYLDGMKIHPNFLPEKRGKSAFRAIDESITAIFELGCQNVYAEIDNDLRHVLWAVRYLRFSRLSAGKRQLFVRRKLDS